MLKLRKRSLIGQLALLLFFVLAVAFIRQSVDVSQDKMVASESGPEEALLLSEEGREVYAAGNPYDETVALIGMGDYWATRYTYPTFQFDQNWLVEAAEQDRFVPSGMPSGDYSQRGESLLTLEKKKQRSK